MPKVGGVEITPGLEDEYNKNLQSGDRYIYSRVGKRNAMISRAKKKSLTGRSLLNFFAELWWALPDIEKDNFIYAGGLIGLSGWQLFIADNSQRYQLGLPPSVTINPFHLLKVGHIRITEPAQSIKIAQYHPPDYFVLEKVPGFQTKYRPVLVKENFTFPFQISINFLSTMTPVGVDLKFSFHAIIRHDYQGQALYSECGVILNTVPGWSTEAILLTKLKGEIKSYTLFIEFSGVQGDFWFDFVKSNHSGQNWAIDPFCEEIDRVYTRGFSRVPQPWQVVNIPEGASYESIYLP